MLFPTVRTTRNKVGLALSNVHKNVQVYNNTKQVKLLPLTVVRAVGRIMSGRSIGKIMIIILGFRVGTSKNKSIDHRVKAHISLLVIRQCQVH